MKPMRGRHEARKINILLLVGSTDAPVDLDAWVSPTSFLTPGNFLASTI